MIKGTKNLSILLISLFLILFPLLFLVNIHGFLTTYPAQEEIHKIIDIPEGTGLRKAADLLFKEGLITNRDVFVFLGKFTGIEKRIIPGEYDLHTHMLPDEILNLFRIGKVIHYRVTIPEGMTASNIGRILEKKGLADQDIFMGLVHDREFINNLEIDAESLEGYLFPDTYYISRHIKERDIIKRMVARFHEIYSDEFKSRQLELNMTQHEVLVLASIIQKEMGIAEEGPLISAVFHNRLKRKMLLQSDPTVIYAIPNFDGNLRRVHLRIDSPYNTYRKRGLPPGPISNPGEMAIRAALYPADVDYLYFVSKNNRTHHFSYTLSEHNKAVWRYQKAYYKSARRRRGIKDLQEH